LSPSRKARRCDDGRLQAVMSIGGSDLDKAITQLRACRPIAESQVRELCHKARELLIEEGNVVGVDAPVTVRLYGMGCLHVC
jgi:hypothetical protein